MLTAVAAWIVVTLQLYAGLGVLFAIAFVIVGVNRVDPVARDSGWGFRLMIFPGSVAFWPLLLYRWVHGLPPPVERNAHRAAAGEGRR